MMHLFINGLGASAGGGLTYLRNVLPHLSARQDLRVSVLLQSSIRQEFESLLRVAVLTVDNTGGTAQRFWYEQTALPRLIRRSGADVLISTGNFALRNSPVPQVLLSRNSLYTSAHFMQDLRLRRHYSIWLDTRLKAMLAARSVAWADCTVAPSSAFAAELQKWTGHNVSTVYHGFDETVFLGPSTPLPAEVQQKLKATEGMLRLLFVSHYNYYRNFETLFRAFAGLRQQIPGVKLLLTTKLEQDCNPGLYQPREAAALIEELELDNDIIQLGHIPYSSLHHVYRSADIYVTAAYTESFAHPLVEAMACGVPVVASNIAVHQEICGDAALYFSCFSIPDLIRTVAALANDAGQRSRMSDAGRCRAARFSWSKHVREIVDLAARLKNGSASPPVAVH
jgi:glycosyltransferase involved in cell wall biosynthesis